MFQIKLDDSITKIARGENTTEQVGQLITQIHSILPENRIITKVLVDGIPVTKEKADLERLVDSIQEIEIKTTDKAIWEVSGLDMAVSCLERVQTSLIKTSELFRDEDKGKANRFFAHCIEGLERFLEAVTITRYACKLDFAAIQTEGMTLQQVETHLTNILKSVLDSQEAKEFEELAEKVEFELIPNLSQWKRALNEIKSKRENGV